MMVLVVLADGGYLEVERAVDVVKEGNELLFCDPKGSIVRRLPMHEALAYTLNPAVAQAMMDGKAIESWAPSSHEPKSDNRKGPRIRRASHYRQDIETMF